MRSSLLTIYSVITRGFLPYVLTRLHFPSSLLSSIVSPASAPHLIIDHPVRGEGMLNEDTHEETYDVKSRNKDSQA